MGEKLTGTYYTPINVVGFMLNYLKQQKHSFLNVLEPSAGDGRFIDLIDKLYKCKITGIELYSEKVSLLKNKNYSNDVDILEKNFLDYATESAKKYNLILGNPPYINIKNINKESLANVKEICKVLDISTSVMKNMWVAFVIASLLVLSENGTIFFILPMEFLQVQYAEKLRNYLEKKFNTIHIISFDEPIFANIEQEVCLVYLTNNPKELPYVSYQIYKDAKCDKPYRITKIMRNKPLKKWSNAVLSDDEIELLNDIGIKYTTINGFGESSPGIVTGGNKYFIVNNSFLGKYECREFVIPIIQKSSLIKKQLIIDDVLLKNLDEKDTNMYLLNLSEVSELNMPIGLNEYICKIGKEKNKDEIELKSRYKCSNRKPWYGVPIVKNGDIVFFKRYDKLPRLCINESGVHTTDIGYNLRLKKEYDKYSFAFCFYNSLSLAQCEFYGRYYGGGVSELVPSEFKQIAIPYRKISRRDILKLNEMFNCSESIQDIILFVNSKTIALDMEETVIKKLNKIRETLMNRRIKDN